MTITDSDLGYPPHVDQTDSAEVDPNSAPAMNRATPTVESLVRSSLPVDQLGVDSHRCGVDGDPSSDAGQDIHATQRAVAGVASNSEQANGGALPTDVSPARTILPPEPAIVGSPAALDSTPAPGDLIDGSASAAMADAASKGRSLTLADPFLALAADVLDDLERVRIANENRLRQLTRSEEDVDGVERGFGLDETHPDVARLRALVDALAKAEHDAELNLERLMRRHPLGPWVKQARGVGEKQAARLLAAIGDPYWNTLHDRPRTVSELWAYCGYHVLPAGHGMAGTHAWRASGDQLGGDPDQRGSDTRSSPVGVAAVRARGQRANWSATAKMRAYLVSTSIVKCRGAYRDVYDEARERYQDSVHEVECRRCGPAGRPAAAGSPLSAGHQHARALRLVSKAVLRDLWREAKRLHDLHGQSAGV